MITALAHRKRAGSLLPLSRVSYEPHLAVLAPDVSWGVRNQVLYADVARHRIQTRVDQREITSS